MSGVSRSINLVIVTINLFFAYPKISLVYNLQGNKSRYGYSLMRRRETPGKIYS